MTEAEINDWLARWAADNIHEGYTDSAASMEQAAGDCLSAAEAAGISTSAVNAAAGGDLAAYLLNFKLDNAEGE